MATRTIKIRSVNAFDEEKKKIGENATLLQQNMLILEMSCSSGMKLILEMSCSSGMKLRGKLTSSVIEVLQIFLYKYRMRCI